MLKLRLDWDLCPGELEKPKKCVTIQAESQRTYARHDPAVPCQSRHVGVVPLRRLTHTNTHSQVKVELVKYAARISPATIQQLHSLTAHIVFVCPANDTHTHTHTSTSPSPGVEASHPSHCCCCHASNSQPIGHATIFCTLRIY